MVLAGNKKAYFDYFIEDKFEAGIELVGSEVKSAKAGKVSIKESFIRIINGEVFIMGMSIVPWSFGSVYNPEERRVRKLLLHKKVGIAISTFLGSLTFSWDKSNTMLILP